MSLIYSLMVRSVQNTLIVNGGKSPTILRTRGFFQGSVISCLLFNVFIDPLIPLINNAGLENTLHERPHCLAFADDVNAGAATVEQAQAQASAIQEWSNRQGMEINLEKCGILGLPPGATVHIDSGPLPQPASYKYLGIEVKSRGIDWPGYTSRVLDKTTKLLDYLIQIGNDWSSFVKCAIYKTFVRPLTDYGFAPVLYLARQNRSCGKETLSTLQAIHTKAHRWIFATSERGPCNLQLLESITALAPPIRRLDELAARFTLHLERCHIDNPIRRLIDFVKTKCHFWKLIHACSQTHPIINNYISTMTATPLRERVSFNTWLKHDRIDWINQRAASNRQGNKLPKLILPSSRRGASLYDHCLAIPNKQLQDNALRWRQNRVWNPAKHRCKCGQPMNRTHITQCTELPQPHALIESPSRICRRGRPPLQPSQLEQAIAKDIDDLSQIHNTPIDNYTCLDFFLNHGRIESFAHWLSLYQDSIAS
jgi:hypothetical protein